MATTAVRRPFRRDSGQLGEALAEEVAPLMEGPPPHAGRWSTLPSAAWAAFAVLIALAIAAVVIGSVGLGKLNDVLDGERQLLEGQQQILAAIGDCCAQLKALLDQVLTWLQDITAGVLQTLANTETIISLVEALDLSSLPRILNETIAINATTVSIKQDTTEILALLAALQQSIDDCCAALQSSIATILTDLATILSELSTLLGLSSQILTVVQDIEAAQCLPLWTATQILDPGCYYFATDIVCNATNPDTCFLLNNDVQIDGRGRSLTVLDSGTTAFLIPFVWNVRISNMFVTTPTPSAKPQSIGFHIFETDGVAIEDVRLTHFFRPIQVEYATSVHIDRVTITDSNLADLLYGYTTRFISLFAVSGVYVTDCVFQRTNVAGGDPTSVSYGLTAVAADGLASDGLFVRDSVFSDAAISIVTSSEFDPVTNVIIERNAFDVNDPLFPHQFIGVGGCPVGSRCASPSSLVVRGNSMANRNAAPTFDGIWIERVDSALIEDNAIVANPNGSAPNVGSLFAALVHVCWGQSAIWTGAQSGYCRGVVVRGNSLVGGPYNTSTGAPYEREAQWGVLVEAGAYEALVEGNALYGYSGGYGAGTNSHGIAYPAQTPAAIYVGGGTVGCHVKSNSLSNYGGALGSQTVSGAGVWVAGYGFYSSLLTPSSPTIYVGAALSTRVESNSASYSTAYGFIEQGSNTRMWNNEAQTNLAGGYLVPSTVVVQCFGCTQRAGSNLDDCNAPAGNWTC